MVIKNADADPWEYLGRSAYGSVTLEAYPEELQLAQGRLANLVVQESGFVRRGDVAANIVIAKPNQDRFGARFTRGAVVASVGDPDNRTGGLATYNAVAVDWRGLNLSRTMWVIKREHGRPGWSMIPELWREFIAGAQQERRSMMAPLAESLAIAIRRAAARGVDVGPEVLESANHWQDVVEELLTMKKSETEEGAPAAWAGNYTAGSAAARAKANERLQSRLARGRRGAPRAPVPSREDEFRGTAELLAKMAERIDAMNERLDEFDDDFKKLAEVVSASLTSQDELRKAGVLIMERVSELAKVVEELREDLGEEGTDVPATTPPKI